MEGEHEYEVTLQAITAHPPNIQHWNVCWSAYSSEQVSE